jgi:hypothetical protein
LALIVLVAAYSWGCDLKVVEELLGLARVFAGDPVNAAQNVHGAEGNVAEVAYGCGHKVETGRERIFSVFRHAGLVSGALASFLAFHAALL